MRPGAPFLFRSTLSLTAGRTTDTGPNIAPVASCAPMKINYRGWRSSSSALRFAFAAMPGAVSLRSPASTSIRKSRPEGSPREASDLAAAKATSPLSVFQRFPKLRNGRYGPELSQDQRSRPAHERTFKIDHYYERGNSAGLERPKGRSPLVARETKQNDFGK